jgi:hypothetical protein
MFPHTVTVYNKYKDGTTEKWQRTILYGVLWDAIKGAVTRKTGVTSADGLQLIIPMSVRASRSAYKPPKEWAVLEDKTNAWTLQSGDMVALGALEYEIVKSSSELKEFDHVLTITSVDTKNFGSRMDYWEVSAK